MMGLMMSGGRSRVVRIHDTLGEYCSSGGNYNWQKMRLIEMGDRIVVDQARDGSRAYRGWSEISSAISKVCACS